MISSVNEFTILFSRLGQPTTIPSPHYKNSGHIQHAVSKCIVSTWKNKQMHYKQTKLRKQSHHMHWMPHFQIQNQFYTYKMVFNIITLEK